MKIFTYFSTKTRKGLIETVPMNTFNIHFHQCIRKIQCSPFKMLWLGSTGMDHVISESILQRPLWSFSYNSFVKLHGKKIQSHNIIGIAPITHIRHVRNKNSNNQGRSPNVIKVIFHTIKNSS